MLAQVDKYEVTWTTHLIQKHKTWHDGTFTFHWYNQRALLFDDRDIQVGDEFIGNKPINEGDMLQFDRYLVSIEQKLQSETREIGTPNKSSNNAITTPKPKQPLTKPVSSNSPCPKTNPNSVYKHLRTDPLSKPFVTPLKRQREPSPPAVNDCSEDLSVELTQAVSNTPERPSEKQSTELENIDDGKVVSNWSSDDDEANDDYPDTGPWTAEAYALFN